VMIYQAAASACSHEVRGVPDCSMGTRSEVTSLLCARVRTQREAESASLDSQPRPL